MFKLAGACSKTRGQIEGVDNKTRELLERMKDMAREQTVTKMGKEAKQNSKFSVTALQIDLLHLV